MVRTGVQARRDGRVRERVVGEGEREGCVHPIDPMGPKDTGEDTTDLQLWKGGARALSEEWWGRLVRLGLLG